ECPAYSMNAKSIQRIVVSQPRFQFGAGEEWDDSRCDSDNDCAARGDISASRCNHHKSAHSAGTKSEDAWFAAQCVLEHGPCERGNSRCKCCGRERIRCDSIRRERASCVETVPSHPKQTGSHHAKHHAVWCHDFFFKSEPVPKEDTQDQRGPTRSHVDHCSAGEIDRSDFCMGVPNSVHPPIDSPNHVGDRKIDSKHPGADENEHRREPY